ncbi:MAG: hypothetical protein V4525_05655 [Pseudomonadota bacterium]
MKRTQVWIACLLSLPLLSQAVTLSEPIVRSGLGQRFIAEVEVFDLERSQWLTLNAVIATPEVYELQGVEYPASVGDMSIFILRHGDGRPYLRIVGERPLNEAFLNLILDIGWKDGHVIRKYTILPDLPVNDPKQQDGADGYTIQQRLARREQRYLKRKIDPADQMMDTAQSILRTESADDELNTNSDPQGRHAWSNRVVGSQRPLKDGQYRISSGDTLHAIARRWSRPDLGIYQKMLVLYQHNPQLFIGGNPNRMIRGHWMSTPKLIQYVPDTDSAARAEWRALLHNPHKWHNGQFLAEADENANQSQEATASDNVASGENRPQGSPESQNDERNSTKNGAASSAAQENSIAQQLDRLAISHGMSKKEIETYQRLLQMENQIRLLIANVRKRSPKLAMSPGLESLPGEAQSDSAIDASKSPVANPLQPVDSTVKMPGAEPNSGLNQGAGTLPNTSSGKIDGVSVPLTNANNSVTAASPAHKASEASEVSPHKPKRSRLRRSTEAPLPVNNSITDNIPWWVGLLSLLAMGTAIGGAIIIQARRKQRQAIVDVLMKESAELAEAPTIFTDTGSSINAAASAADLAGAGSLNRENLLNFDTDTHIDPLTEADVYISYERYDSAEALLKVAEEHHPDSPEVLWRLFTVYQHMSRPIEKRAYAARLHLMYDARDPKQHMICEALGIEFGSMPGSNDSKTQQNADSLSSDNEKEKLSEITEAEEIPPYEKTEVAPLEMEHLGIELAQAEGYAALMKEEADVAREEPVLKEEDTAKMLSTPLISELSIVPMILIPELALPEEKATQHSDDASTTVDLKKPSLSLEEENHQALLMPSLADFMSVEIPALNFEFEKETENVVIDDSSTEALVKNQHDLMHCQLELARVWLEQGRTEAASALLEAIVKTGTPVYAEEAQSLLDNMIH